MGKMIFSEAQGQVKFYTELSMQALWILKSATMHLKDKIKIRQRF